MTDITNDIAEATYAAARAMFDEASELYADAVKTLAEAITTLKDAKALYEQSAKDTCASITDMPSTPTALAQLRAQLSKLSDEERSAAMYMINEKQTPDLRAVAPQYLFDSSPASRAFLAAFFRLSFLFDADRRAASAIN